MTDRRGLHRPILGAILLLLSSFPSTASVTDRHSHNVPLRVFVPKYFNSWNLGTGITSLNFKTHLHDGTSQTRRTVTRYVSPHLVRLPHFPSATALRCHLRTVTSTTDRHKLRRWSLLHFSLKISAFSFRQISCKTKETYIKISTKRAYGHTKLKEKVLIIP